MSFILKMRPTFRMLIDFIIVKRRIHDGNDKRRQEENSEIHFSQKREKTVF